MNFLFVDVFSTIPIDDLDFAIVGGSIRFPIKKIRPINNFFGCSIEDFADFLGVSRRTLMRWYSEDCKANYVTDPKLIDMLYLLDYITEIMPCSKSSDFYYYCRGYGFSQRNFLIVDYIRDYELLRKGELFIHGFKTKWKHVPLGVGYYEGG